MASTSASPRTSEASSEPRTEVSSLEKPAADMTSETMQGENHEGEVATAPTSSDEDPGVGSPGGSDTSRESGEASPIAPADSAAQDSNAPPLPDEAPPLPKEQPPPVEDDGWDYQWDPIHQAYFFYNRFTNETTWDNPRLPKATASSSSDAQAPAAPGTAEPPKNERPPAGGYNPAIHGDYDPNAWYAKNAEENPDQDQGVDAASAYAAIGSFNRFTGRWQAADQNPERHNDEAKSKRQMNAFFDVDAAANSHDGRSLKAERSGKKPSKAELKAFKEKRRAKKEEKRRAWLRD